MVVDNKAVYTMRMDDLGKGGIRYLCDAVDLDTEEAGRLIDFTDLPKEIMEMLALKGMTWFRKEAA